MGPCPLHQGCTGMRVVQRTSAHSVSRHEGAGAPFRAAVRSFATRSARSASQDPARHRQQLHSGQPWLTRVNTTSCSRWATCADFLGAGQALCRPPGPPASSPLTDQHTRDHRHHLSAPSSPPLAAPTHWRLGRRQVVPAAAVRGEQGRWRRRHALRRARNPRCWQARQLTRALLLPPPPCRMTPTQRATSRPSA